MKHKKADHREGDPFFVEHRRFELLSATSMVAAPHWGDCSLSVEKAADEISATGGRRRLSPSTAAVIVCDQKFNFHTHQSQNPEPP